MRLVRLLATLTVALLAACNDDEIAPLTEGQLFSEPVAVEAVEGWEGNFRIFQVADDLIVGQDVGAGVEVLARDGEDDWRIRRPAALAPREGRRLNILRTGGKAFAIASDDDPAGEVEVFAITSDRPDGTSIATLGRSGRESNSYTAPKSARGALLPFSTWTSLSLYYLDPDAETVRPVVLDLALDHPRVGGLHVAGATAYFLLAYDTLAAPDTRVERVRLAAFERADPAGTLRLGPPADAQPRTELLDDSGDYVQANATTYQVTAGFWPRDEDVGGFRRYRYRFDLASFRPLTGAWLEYGVLTRATSSWQEGIYDPLSHTPLYSNVGARNYTTFDGDLEPVTGLFADLWIRDHGRNSYGGAIESLVVFAETGAHFYGYADRGGAYVLEVDKVAYRATRAWQCLLDGEPVSQLKSARYDAEANELVVVGHHFPGGTGEDKGVIGRIALD